MDHILWLLKAAYDLFIGVLGNATWENIKEDKKKWVPVMLGTLFYAAWNLLVSPLGPMIFVNCLGVFAIGLLIANEIQTRRLQKKWERGELTPPSLLRMLEDLKNKLAAIEDTQPCLIADHFSEPRAIPLDRQPEPPSHPILFNSWREESRVSLAFLRIANRPKNHNMQAIAHNVYAWVSYCDKEGNNLFPPLPGVWLTPQNANDPYEISTLFSEIGSLKSNESAYLGIAIGEILTDKRSPDVSILYAALTASSTQWRSWLHGDFMLREHTENGNIYVKVVIGCHRYETTYSYLLKQQIAGDESGLVLVPLS